MEERVNCSNLIIIGTSPPETGPDATAITTVEASQIGDISRKYGTRKNSRVAAVQLRRRNRKGKARDRRG